MKLELKHLAPYLPYGLGFLHRKKLYQLLQLNLYYDQKPMQVEGWDGEETVSVFLEGCKPILRPLTDLIKEIEHNGEVFIPWKKIVEKQIEIGIYESRFHKPDYRANIITKPFGEVLKVTDNGDTWVLYLSFSNPERCKHFIWELLIEWHFDVFGLIEKGLAADINTLKL